MPIEIYAKKNNMGVFIPDTQDSRELVAELPNAVYRMDLVRPRNYLFHKKFFVLLDFAYDYWEAPDVKHNGIPIQKNKDLFRENMIIAAGFYTMGITIRGDARAIADSISFGKMGQEKFDSLYKRVFDACWHLVFAKLGTFTPEQAEKTVLEIMSFS